MASRKAISRLLEAVEDQEEREEENLRGEVDVPHPGQETLLQLVVAGPVLGVPVPGRVLAPGLHTGVTVGDEDDILQGTVLYDGLQADPAGPTDRTGEDEDRLLSPGRCRLEHRELLDCPRLAEDSHPSVPM